MQARTVQVGTQQRGARYDRDIDGTGYGHCHIPCCRSLFRVHLRVGEAQQRIRPVSVKRPYGDADTRIDRKPLLVRADGLAQRLHDFIRNLFGIVPSAEQGQQHHKLIASDACHRISATHTVGHAPGGFP